MGIAMHIAASTYLVIGIDGNTIFKLCKLKSLPKAVTIQMV